MNREQRLARAASTKAAHRRVEHVTQRVAAITKEIADLDDDAVGLYALHGCYGEFICRLAPAVQERVRRCQREHIERVERGRSRPDPCTGLVVPGDAVREVRNLPWWKRWFHE